MDETPYWQLGIEEYSELGISTRLADAGDAEVLEAVQTGDEDAMMVFVLRQIGLVLKVADTQKRRLGIRPTVEFEDLVQAGVIGLMRAARRWKPEHEDGNLSFSTFAWRYYIRPEILRTLREGRAVWLPDETNRIWKAAFEIEAERGGERGAFTVEELAERANYTPKTVKAFLDASKPAQSLEVLDEMWGDGSKANRDAGLDLVLDEDTGRASRMTGAVRRPTEEEALSRVYYEQLHEQVEGALEGLADSGVKLGDATSVKIGRLCLGLDGEEPMTASDAGRAVANLQASPSCKRFRAVRRYLQQQIGA